MPDLPEPLPVFGDTPVQIAAWAAKATNHEVVASWRPGRSVGDGLVVRLADGGEIVFESVADACRPETLFAAFLARDGVSMPEYTKPQVRVIVGALVRMAEVSGEGDERDHWGMLGEAFLRASLTAANIRTIERAEPEEERDRLAFYREALSFAARLGDVEENPFQPVWFAKDADAMFISRGAFLAFARRREHRAAPKIVMMQMRRLGWEPVELRPYKPGDWKHAIRPHLRLWRIPNGWDGLWIHNGDLAEDPEDLEESQSRSPAQALPNARGRATRLGKRDCAGLRDRDSEDGETGR